MPFLLLVLNYLDFGLLYVLDTILAVVVIEPATEDTALVRSPVVSVYRVLYLLLILNVLLLLRFSSIVFSINLVSS